MNIETPPGENSRRLQIQDPKSVALSGSVSDLLAQVNEQIEALNKRRPFPPETERSLRQRFLPDRVTATLNIEGIGVTRRETLTIMEAMTVSSYASREEKEILNALKADAFVYEAVSSKAELSPGLIRHINKLVLDGVHSSGGTYRQEDIEISGAAFRPPSHGDVPDLIQEICELFPASEFIHPIAQAAWLHDQFTYVHPFLDGNGRTARLLQDFCLLRRGLYPVGIPSSRRDDYYTALQQADAGKWDELVELIALSELGIINRVDAITREPERTQAWISKLAKAASAKKTGTLHKQYLVWRSRMELVRQSFIAIAEEVERSSDVIGVAHRSYDMIDFDKWRQISEYGRSDRTWAFSLLFFADGEAFYKALGFFRRHRADPMDPFYMTDNLVSLSITGQEAHSREPPNFYSYADPHIRLRELLYLNEQLICYEQPLPGQAWSATDEKSIEDIVKAFFEDVFYRKAGIGG